MKISCLPVSFFGDIIDMRMSLGEWATIGKKAGLDAIDISILFLPDRLKSTASKVRKEIEEKGMSVTMVTTYPDFTHPDLSQRQRELELELEAIAAAEELGAKFVRVTAGQAHPSTSREDGISWATEGLIQLVDLTKDSPVTLVYENHGKPGAWEYTDFSQPPDIFLEIVKSTSDCELELNYDTANATAFGDDPLQLLDLVIDRVRTIHAADTSKCGVLDHVLLGTGATPFEKIFERLANHSWDGWICIEEASFKGEEGVIEATKFVRSLWEEVVARSNN